MYRREVRLENLLDQQKSHQKKLPEDRQKYPPMDRLENLLKDQQGRHQEELQEDRQKHRREDQLDHQSEDRREEQPE
ncbi:Protein CBG12884 [Caenorhabditis briggsae]|uniref:Uncharacterized protein n=2 Tax=Caenorhabditis briggsae TaxID=6238 RepID=A0AAE9DXV0_CAEBR|nr:Protein CBG12884 [Caenorhabditis briggsae]ULU13187.1 hypothetical protein L3Y34_015996 [Caenorhabditis briggsae]CAP31782.2 Protein CBG12884 [Caenorhabditis briggsae]